jgi:hypothetical protein
LLEHADSNTGRTTRDIKKKAESFWENLYLKLKEKEEFQKINLLKLYQEQVCYIQSKSSEVQNHKKAVENGIIYC